MRVVVTGATGFLGRPLVNRLLEAGHAVRALVRPAALSTMRPLPAGVDCHMGDLTQPATLHGMLGDMDAVIHLAAATAGDWPTQRRGTVEGTAALLEACRASNVRRFVHVSTVAVYDTRFLADGHTLDVDAALAEPSAALGPYARSKVEAELQVRAAAERGLDLTIVRPGLVYGPHRLLFEHLGKPIGPLNRRIAYGSPGQRLPLVHVDSVADALVRILASPATVGQTYNVVDEHECTRTAYLALYQQLTSRQQRTWYLPAGPVALLCDLKGRLPLKRTTAGVGGGQKIRGRALSLRYTTAALTRDTGWTQTRPLRRALAEAVEATPGPQGRPLRVAVVGAGMNAPCHLRPLQAHRHVALVGLMDTQADRAAALAEAYDIPLATASLDDLFDHGRPDVVHLVTPPQTHARLACDLMQRGADVFCEKPLAMSRAECQAMTQAAAAHGRSLAVNHNLWFDPRLAAARRAVAAGAVGDVVHVETFRAFAPRGMSQAPHARTAWLRGLPGGLLEDIAPHPLYTTLAFLQEDVALLHAHRWCSGHAATEQADDELRLSLGDGRATAQIAISLNARPDTFTIRVHGTRATLLVDVQNMLVLHQRPGRGPRVLDRARQLAGVSLGSLTQAAGNALRLAGKRTTPPGEMTPIIREHVQCMIERRRFPLGPATGTQVVSLLEQVWPRPQAAAVPAPPVPLPRDERAA